jgi:selenocysteine lyase/cysteine desulfurase
LPGQAKPIEFIADLGSRFGNLEAGSTAASGKGWSERRRLVVAGMEAMESYEQPLAAKLIAELTALDKVKIYGPPEGCPRTSTVSFTVDGVSAAAIAAELGEKGLFVWDGHFYAVRLVERLGLIESGGLVRVGLSPYNTEGEIDRLLDAVGKIAG